MLTKIKIGIKKTLPHKLRDVVGLPVIIVFQAEGDMFGHRCSVEFKAGWEQHDITEVIRQILKDIVFEADTILIEDITLTENES